jgi:hypothetical protein
MKNHAMTRSGRGEIGVRGSTTMLGQRQTVAGKIGAWLVMAKARGKNKKKRWWREEKMETGEKVDFIQILAYDFSSLRL